MTRRGKHAGHENSERWLVSYADFITLLFAFFVVMFANSQADKSKARQISEAVTKALQDGQVGAVVAAVFGGATGDKGKPNAMMKGPGGGLTTAKSVAPPDAVPAELKPSFDHLTRELKAEIAAGKLQLKLQPRGLTVSLMEAAFFPSGEDAVDPRTFPTLEKIADAVRPLANLVRLEGHTDSLRIHNSRFRSNWELSTARAVAMLELMTGRLHIPERRLAVAGYADTSPLESNETAGGRAKNRRVDLVILSPQGQVAEPVSGRG